MATQVIKNNGEKVPFDAKRIIRAITRAAKDANLAPEEINRVVNEVSNKVIQFVEAKDKVLSSEIRDKTLSELDLIAPAVLVEWRRFMNNRRR